MKILQLVHTLDPRIGGVVRSVLELSDGLARRGHQIDIVALDDPDSPWLGRIKHKVHALDVGLGHYRYSGNLTRWLKQHGGEYDRVLVNGLWQYISFAAWRRFAGSRPPYYVFPHGMLDPWFKRTFPLKHLKKWMYWPWAEYRVLRDAAAVVFTSEEERLAARTSFWLYSCREKISPLGIKRPEANSDQAKEVFFGKFSQLRNRKMFLFLGRLHPKKGCDILIDAFARNPSNNFSLVLAGPDQIGWRQTLQARAAQSGAADRIVFAGMLEGEMKQGALAGADAFVLPSHQENFGLSVVEALAAGLPVLISNRVNIWREIAADDAGFVEEDDLAGTTRLIQRWHDASPSQRDALRDNARKCFAQRFEVNRAIDSLLQILEEPLRTR